jgi:hypothetical protein
MANIIKKLQEKRIDNLYAKKKEAVMSGNTKKKERIDSRIAKVRGKSLSQDDFVKKGGSIKRKKK